MRVHVFGVTSSPSCCIYALRQVAEAHRNTFPETADRILKGIYVDNLLDSVDTVKEAQALYQQIVTILGNSGFRMRKWASSSRNLLAKIPPTPVTVEARIRLQELWVAKYGWDDTPDQQFLVRWKAWLADMSNLSSLTVPRCVCPTRGQTELHIFSDASKVAYGAVAYLRVSPDRNNPHITLLMARARVAPIRQMTTPRLELQAAVIAVTLASSITKGSSLCIGDVTFWTDSSVVLHWLNGDGRRYSQFVENRASEILNASVADQWRFVPSKENPADDLSRGLTVTSLHCDHRWFKGPKFFHRHRSDWPTFELPFKGIKKQYLEELVVTRALQLKRSDGNNDAIVDAISRVSELHRLLRIIRLVQRFVNLCRRSRANCTHPDIETSTFANAWKLCIRKVQEECFSTEINLLKTKATIPARSRLRQLNPFLDEFGIIRVGGRLKHTHLSAEAKHPPILSSKHHFTTILIEQVHKDRLHSGTEDTLAEWRARARVIDGRAAVRRAIYNCVICRKNQARPVAPLMAQLPQCHVKKPAHVFASTGIDYFGLISVSERRSSVKRWICLFTCMAVRAVHLEINGSLREGACHQYVYDNGTNFVAGQREVPGVQRLNSTHISEYMAQRGVKWQFNPPGAPHFGGAWERLIRSVKRPLSVALSGQRLTDEVLQTVIVKVEGLLNGRPLIHVSHHPNDEKPLTPNHFLLGRPYAMIPPDVFHDKEITSRRYWRVAQTIVDQFWRRWMREYLPTLNRGRAERSKQENIKPGI
ncbi:hypothetical protein M514_19705 [Trichuris suis]|uniref:Integrase catalytic domain-containing protein n=1 Tax=Trichuris suis TaxID=68888 RepID=A0A085NFH7_9BILA|nr:hypothetical protein M514_19705 [Trichuris suis]